MASMRRGSPEFLAERNKRVQQLNILRTTFPDRVSFISMVMVNLFGYDPTPMQLNMIQYMDEQDDHYMVQMPRGEGKTLITSVNAVYELIVDPSCRVAIFSGNDTVSKEISKFVYDIFHNLEILQFMLPDRALGDKTSQEGFSVCGYLKGIDKSPSVRCRPIFGGFQGIRADKIIGDDLEMLSNSNTAPMRAKLRQYIQELESLLDGSKEGQMIQLLGTPQTTDSVYNVLPSLGFKIRIWTARVPSEEMIDYYGDHLAPYVQALYDSDPSNRTGYGLDGTRGAPTDPLRYDNEVLNRKEQTQAMGGMFDLQYMLCTKLSDADLYPLDIHKLLFMDLMETKAPIHINSIRSPEKMIKLPMGFSVPDAKMHEIMGASNEVEDYESIVMYIDPSGGGSQSRDELAYAVVKNLNGNVYVDRIHGMTGGFKPDNLEHLADTIGYYWSLGLPLVVYVEDNYGNGMFRQLLQGVLKNKNIMVGLEGDHVTGQKELRIIDTVLPLINSNRLIFNTKIIETDVASCTVYNARERSIYSFFHQLKYLTRDRQSLQHDDRLDALAGALKFFAELLVVNQQDMKETLKNEQLIQKYRKMFPNRAEQMLLAIGLIKETKYSGLNHTNFGKFRKNRNGNSKNKDYKEQTYKTPFEKERAERIERKTTTDRSSRSSKGNRGYGGATFYNRRKLK